MKHSLTELKQYGFAFSLLLCLAVAGSLYLSYSLHHPSSPSSVVKTPVGITKAEDSPNYNLVIAKIGVKAPIALNVPGTDENIYLKALEVGVAQYAGTVIPGQVGNSFIFGHSSFSSNEPGQYKQIFEGLNGLVKGDKFVINHEGDVYTYKVVYSGVISPMDHQFLADTSDERVTLMTCWPPGTTSMRYIVQGVRQ